MNNNSHNQPGKEFRAGTIVAAVWETTTTINGRSVPQHSIRIQKRYRDERTGEWKTTTYFRPDDLPKLVLVANKVYEDVMLRATNEETQADAPRT
jgi:hypothetical protein